MSKSSSRPNDFFDLPEEARADDQYVVEKILAKRRTRKGKWEYLLKWAGFSDADNTWEGQADIHPDLIAEFDRQQAANEPSSSIYSTHGDEPPPPKKSRASLSTTSSSNNNDSPPAKKKKKTSSSVVLTSTATTASPPPPPPPSHLPPAAPAPAPTSEAPRKVFGVEKGWRVRAVIGAAKQRDSSVLYAVDYMQGSPTLREYVPSEIAHIHIPRELIEFFQRKIVWNSPKDTA